MKTFFIIVNPNADHGQAANIWEQVEQILLTRQVKYEAHQTTHVGHAKQLIHLNFGKQKAENIKDQVVLVVGGDGTLNETFNALKHEAPLEVPLAFIPVGQIMVLLKGSGSLQILWLR